MIKRLTGDVLNQVLWLGAQIPGTAPEAVGSGVIANLNGAQYLITALHVYRKCNAKPLVRFNAKWNQYDLKTIAIDADTDIAVLKSHVTLAGNYETVKFGEPGGLKYGQIGYALGFPGFNHSPGQGTSHIVEGNGRPLPIVTPAMANYSAEKILYCAGFVNAGFSGGAIVFPIEDKHWSIVGIITHFPTVKRPVLNNGRETGEYVLEHTGLVGFTNATSVVKLIETAEATY